MSNLAVLATTTLYNNPNDVRAKLAVQTIQGAGRENLKIVVIDASTVPVKKTLRENGALLFDQVQPGMGPGRREAIKMAAEIAGADGIVVWLEPEKASLVPHIKKLTVPIIENEADLVIAERVSMDSYPEMQRYAEFLGNRGFHLLTGRNLDVWSGVRIFRADFAYFFVEYKGEHGDLWDSIFIPVLRMIKDGKRVVGVKVDYVHPSEQTATEDNFQMYKKRITQLTTLVNALEKEAIKLELYHEPK